MWKSYADIGICQAFGLADLVVDSLLDVTDASLDALERALGPATR
jgi:hypothetical protein